MIAPDAIAVLLLAAGGSSRFGPRDKLAEPLEGLPLGLHAARTLARLPFVARIAVTRQDGPDFRSEGFEPVVNPNPALGQSGSIRIGLAKARVHKPRALLIALADMPFITVAHVVALAARFDAEHLVVASTDGRRPGPPVLFDSSLFAALDGLTGDAGARAWLRSATLVAAGPGELADIDTPEDWRSVLQR